MGFGIGPIPSTSFRQYAKDTEMDEDDADRFSFIIREIDNYYVAHCAKKDK